MIKFNFISYICRRIQENRSAMDYSFLLGPLLGGVIGYITNDIAIRMMFRPHQPKYIFGIRVPFTPGIIPKERYRIAEAAGNTISENLMNPDVLERNLLSPDMIAKIESAFDRFIAKQKNNTETLRTFLGHYLPDSDLSAIQQDTGKELAVLIHTRLSDSSIGPMLSHAVTEHVMKKMRKNLIGKIGADRFVPLIAPLAENLLSKQITQIIKDHSEEMVATIINKESDHLFDTSVCELLDGHDEQILQLRHMLIDGYSTIITTHLPRILATLDISRIIRERINEMDMDESEKIILEVMSKELRAIVWLGALLGCIIGTVNSIL